MATPAPNLAALNQTIAFLSNTIADNEEKLKKSEAKNKSLSNECCLLSKEIQRKYHPFGCKYGGNPIEKSYHLRHI